MRLKAAIPMEDKGHPSQGWFSKRKGTINRSVLIVGLSLCIVAVWRIDPATLRAVKSIGITGWSLLALLLMLAWAASVAAWRQFVHAVSGSAPDWRSAFRQSGLLLTGKYLPGGVFGFVARLYDDDHGSRHQLMIAGLLEQIVSLGMTIAFGGLLYFAAIDRSAHALILALLLPFLALIGVLCVGKAAGRVTKLQEKFSGFPPLDVARFLGAAYLALLVQGTWAAIVFVLAWALFGIDPGFAMGVAGAFGLSVGAGIVIFIAPGGIGVREGAMMALASSWLGADSALLLAAILRIANVGMDLCAGLVALACRKA